jgi:hypothetical protein
MTNIETMAKINFYLATDLQRSTQIKKKINLKMPAQKISVKSVLIRVP